MAESVRVAENGTLQLHHSHLQTLWSCGHQFERFVLDGVRYPPGVAAHIGSGTHGGIRRNMERMIETERREMASEDEVADAARDTVEQRWERDGVLLQPEEETVGLKNLRGQAIDLSVRLAHLHRAEVAPGIEVTAAERPFVIEIPKIAVEIAGQIDIEEPALIRDTKTAGKSPAKDDIDGDDQLTVYALAKRVTDGVREQRVRKDHLVKTSTPKVVSQESVRDDTDAAVMLRRIEASADAIRKGVFVPASQSKSWWCSERWCGLARAGKCPYFRQRKVVPV